MSISLLENNELRISALREIGNIGAGTAMTSLSNMLDKRVQMSVPRVGIVPLFRFTEMSGGPESLAVGVYMPVFGEAPGHVAFLWPEHSAYHLVDELLGRSIGETHTLNEIECSALMEIGNILAASFLTAISEMTRLSLVLTPPAIAVDMSAAILSAIATEFASLENEALTIVTHIGAPVGEIDGYFIFIPEAGSLSAILRALQVEC